MDVWNLNSDALKTSHIVKDSCVVHIVTRKPLNEAMRQYPDAANEIKVGGYSQTGSMAQFPRGS